MTVRLLTLVTEREVFRFLREARLGEEVTWGKKCTICCVHVELRCLLNIQKIKVSLSLPSGLSQVGRMSEQQRPYWAYEWSGYLCREVIKEAQGQCHPHHCLVKAKTQSSPLTWPHHPEAEWPALQEGLLGTGAPAWPSISHLCTCSRAHASPSVRLHFSRGTRAAGSENWAPSSLAVSAKVIS